MHELQDRNVLQLSERCHMSDRDHTLRGSRVFRRDLRLSGSIQFR